MKINRAIVSTDNNPLYYEFWPLVAKAWRNIGFEPTVAVIGAINLDRSYGTIVEAPLIDGISSGFIAQVIRFIIPCMFPEEVSVIGDIDMVPLNRRYFTKNISGYDNDDIIIFSSDAYPSELRYPMCYIAAKGKYFQEIIGLKNTGSETIESFIKDLHALGKNWDTDELFFTEQLHRSPLLEKAILLNRGWSPMAKNRIDRSHWKYSKLGLFLNRYIDAHCLRPMDQYVKQLKNIIDYVDHGSDGKEYFLHSQKKTARNFVDFIKLFKQNYIDKEILGIAERKNLDTVKNKIISFSLYGNDARYTGNIAAIIQCYNKMLPGWKCRVYTAKDVDEKYIALLTSLGCEVFIMRKTGIDARYTIWRFLAIEDEAADAVIIRDMDSLPTSRENKMIAQWLASDKKFHIIRDHVNHNALIMAGMWGAKKNDLNIRKETKRYLLTNNYGVDQVFLEKCVYPLFKNDVIVHDSFARFPDENPIVIPFKPGEGFIGEIYTNDTVLIQNGHLA